MLEVAWGEKQCFDLLSAEDDGEGLRFLGVRDIVDHPRLAQSGFVQKTQSTHRLDKDALGDLLAEEMELIGADVLGAEAIGRDVEVLGKLGDVAQIPVDGVRRVVAICMSSSMRRRKGVMGRWIFMRWLLAFLEMTSLAWRCGHAMTQESLCSGEIGMTRQVQ